MPFTVTTDTLIIAFLAILVILLALWIIRIEKKLKTLLATKNAERIDDTLDAIHKELEEIRSFKANTDRHLDNLEGRMQTTIRGVETVRFNPFQASGSGGNNSFATAFLTENGDGVVVSSLYTRDRTNVFSKHVDRMTPHTELSDEEQDVLTRAYDRIQQH